MYKKNCKKTYCRGLWIAKSLKAIQEQSEAITNEEKKNEINMLKELKRIDKQAFYRYMNCVDVGRFNQIRLDIAI